MKEVKSELLKLLYSNNFKRELQQWYYYIINSPGSEFLPSSENFSSGEKFDLNTTCYMLNL